MHSSKLNLKCAVCCLSLPQAAHPSQRTFSQQRGNGDSLVSVLGAVLASPCTDCCIGERRDGAAFRQAVAGVGVSTPGQQFLCGSGGSMEETVDQVQSDTLFTSKVA